MNKGIIYRVTSPSGKVYIGQSKNTLETRKKRHFWKAFNKNSNTYNSKFHRAIRKYKNRLVWKIIHFNVPISKLNTLERKEVKNYNSFKSGYNSDLGGNTRTTEQSRKIARHGETCHWAKLNKKIVNNIRNMYATGEYTYFDIANFIKNKVTPQTIGKIVRNERWFKKGYIQKKFAQIGERNNNAKLNITEVKEIRKIYAIGKLSHRQLAKKYGVNTPAIYKIVNNVSWKDENYNPPKFDKIINKDKFRKKISYKIAEKIRENHKMGQSISNLVNRYKISYGTICLILRGKIWKKIK